METSMTVSAHHQRQDQRVAAQTVDRSPAWLKTETEDRQYQILASLLSGELKRITPAFRPRHCPRKKALTIFRRRSAYAASLYRIPAPSMNLWMAAGTFRRSVRQPGRRNEGDSSRLFLEKEMVLARHFWALTIFACFIASSA